jgi:hypothetical protein
VFIRIPCQSIRLSTIQDFHVSLLHHKPLLRASYLPRQSGFPRCTLWLTPANGTYDNILRHVWRMYGRRFSEIGDQGSAIADNLITTSRLISVEIQCSQRQHSVYQGLYSNPLHSIVPPAPVLCPSSPPPQLQMQLLEKRRLDATASRLGPPWSSWSADQSPVS